MASVIRGSDNFDSKDVNIGAATAWVNFNGTGTVSIRDQFNVSSITDVGTGQYNANFTTNLADANYSANLSYSNEVAVQHTVGFLVGLLVDRAEVIMHSAANSADKVDKIQVCITCLGGNP